MTRLRYAVSVLLALSTLLLAAAPAGALPIASGSKCKSNWVNNPEAMACFIQGQEDIRNGVSRPHYVACTSDGAIHCCVDTPTGQDCEGISAGKTGGRNHIEDLQMSALLLAQQTIMSRLTHMESVLNDLKATIGEANVCPVRD